MRDRSPKLALCAMLAAALLASSVPGVCRADTLKGAAALGLVRRRVRAEFRLNGFPGKGETCEAISRGVAWRAGQALWEWDQRARGAGRRCAASVLALAWTCPGQRFRGSPRVLARGEALGRLMARARAAGERRYLAFRLVGTLYTYDERLSASTRRELEEAVAALVEDRGSDWEEEQRRARGRFMLSVFRRDVAAADSAARRFHESCKAPAARDRGPAPWRPAATLSAARETLAMEAWTRATEWALPAGAADQAIKGLRSVSDWSWRETGPDPLLALGSEENEAAVAAAFEAALRAVALAAPSRKPWLEALARGADMRRAWAERGDAWPDRAAIVGARLWRLCALLDRLGGKPLLAQRGKRALSYPTSPYAVSATEGRISLMTIEREGISWKASGRTGEFNACGPARSRLFREAWARGFRPGALRMEGLRRPGEESWVWGIEKPAYVRHGPGAAAWMARLRRVAGPSRMTVDRVWAFAGPGLAMFVRGLQGTAGIEAPPAWECVRGRDKRAWLRLLFPKETTFDAARICFLAGQRSWKGVPRTVRVQYSLDGRRWTTLAVKSVERKGDSSQRRIVKVLAPLERISARHLRIDFPDGAEGRVVRVVELEARLVTRDSAGAAVRESVDFARSELGVKAFAESSSSPERGPESAIDGLAALVQGPTPRMWLALGPAPADARFAYGIRSGRSRRLVFPAGRPEVRLEGLTWLHDGEAGFLFARPVTGRVRRVSRGALGFEVLVQRRAFGVLVTSGIEAADVEEMSADKRMVWRVMKPGVVWVEDRRAGQGVIASFGKTSGRDLVADAAGLLCYQRQGDLLDASFAGASGRVGVRMSGVTRVRVNGKAAPVRPGLLIEFPVRGAKK